MWSLSFFTCCHGSSCCHPHRAWKANHSGGISHAAQEPARKAIAIDPPPHAWVPSVGDPNSPLGSLAAGIPPLHRRGLSEGSIPQPGIPSPVPGERRPSCHHLLGLEGRGKKTSCRSELGKLTSKGCEMFSGVVELHRSVKSFVPQMKNASGVRAVCECLCITTVSTSEVDPLQGRSKGHLAGASLEGVCGSEILCQSRCAGPFVASPWGWQVSSLAGQGCAALLG